MQVKLTNAKCKLRMTYNYRRYFNNYKECVRMKLAWKHKKRFYVGVPSNFAVIAASIRGRPVYLTWLLNCGLYSKKYGPCHRCIHTYMNMRPMCVSRRYLNSFYSSIFSLIFLIASFDSRLYLSTCIVIE